MLAFVLGYVFWKCRWVLDVGLSVGSGQYARREAGYYLGVLPV